LHQAFNFAWLAAPWGAASFAEVITSTLGTLADVSASPTWVLSNHDVIRHPTRYGGGISGLARARAATLVMLGLPGSAYLYQGEELGLPEVDVPSERRRDPIWFRTGASGRDGCRVPLPWDGSLVNAGFSGGTAGPWLPQPPGWADYAADQQRSDQGSTLNFYRSSLAARRRLIEARPGQVSSIAVSGEVLTLERGSVSIVLNCGPDPIPLPAGRVIARSDAGTSSQLASDSAAWLLR